MICPHSAHAAEPASDRIGRADEGTGEHRRRLLLLGRRPVGLDVVDGRWEFARPAPHQVGELLLRGGEEAARLLPIGTGRVERQLLVERHLQRRNLLLPLQDVLQAEARPALGGGGSAAGAARVVPLPSLELSRLRSQLAYSSRSPSNGFATPSATRQNFGSPSQPVIRGPAIYGGATYQIYAPSTNPYVADFAQRTGYANNPAYGITQGYTPITYRAFAHGGLSTFAESDKYSTPSEIRNHFTHIATGFEGELNNGIGYDFGLTFNQSNLYGDSPDMMLSRVQEALNGFGGPNCSVPDLNPDGHASRRRWNARASRTCSGSCGSTRTRRPTGASRARRRPRRRPRRGPGPSAHCPYRTAAGYGHAR